MSDFANIVFFRRERTYQEFEQAGPDAGQWIVIGETLMDNAPLQGEYIWIEGKRWYIANRSWSIDLKSEFKIPSVMLTLTPQFVEQNSFYAPYAPKEDFRPTEAV